MPRRSFRSLARDLVPSEPALETADPPDPEKVASGGATAALSGAPVEVEEIGRRTAASDPQSKHPAPHEGEQALEGPDWQKEFASPEELWKRFKDVDRVRGRHANELGQLRRQIRLYERTIRLLLITRDPFERQALLQALGLIHEPRAHPSIEAMVALGEQAHEEATAHAVGA